MKTSKYICVLTLTVAVIAFMSPVTAVLTTFDDYQFVSDTEIQAHSWSFDLTVKEPWSVTGRVLTYQFYHVNDSEPVNYISPVDILIGTGPLLDGGDEYNMSFSWGERYVNVSFYAKPTDVETVISNIGNIHCIARNQESLMELKSVQNGTVMKLSGYLVDVFGWNVSNALRWNTDTQFGNEDCEILVISDVIPGDITSADLIVVIVSSACISILIHVHNKKRCAIPVKQVGKVGKKEK